MGPDVDNVLHNPLLREITAAACTVPRSVLALFPEPTAQTAPTLHDLFMSTTGSPWICRQTQATPDKLFVKSPISILSSAVTRAAPTVAALVQFVSRCRNPVVHEGRDGGIFANLIYLHDWTLLFNPGNCCARLGSHFLYDR